MKDLNDPFKQVEMNKETNKHRYVMLFLREHIL